MNKPEPVEPEPHWRTPEFIRVVVDDLETAADERARCPECNRVGLDELVCRRCGQAILGATA